MKCVALVTFWMLLALAWGCPNYNNYGLLCPYGCGSCNINQVCTSCCNNYYNDTTSSSCVQCTDPNCVRCSPYAGGNTSCSICNIGWAVYWPAAGPAYCVQCNMSTALECQSVNGCTDCVACNIYSMFNGQCQLCNYTRPNCNRCNASQCTGCVAGWAVKNSTCKCSSMQTRSVLGAIPSPTVISATTAPTVSTASPVSMLLGEYADPAEHPVLIASP
jgi:hypothetical protein